MSAWHVLWMHMFILFGAFGTWPTSVPHFKGKKVFGIYDYTKGIQHSSDTCVDGILLDEAHWMT
jgi:hypothetical protein